MSSSVRPETGPMQFGDDWTGVFMRGDHAYGIAERLSAVAEDLRAGRATTRFNLAALDQLILLLASCDHSGARLGLQRLKPWSDCTNE